MAAAAQSGQVELIVVRGLGAGVDQLIVHIVFDCVGLLAGEADIGGQLQCAVASGKGGLVQRFPAGGGAVHLIQIGAVVADGVLIGGGHGGIAVEHILKSAVGVGVEVEHSLYLGIDHVDIGIEPVKLLHGEGGQVGAGAVAIGKAALADHNGLVVGHGQVDDGLDGDHGVMVIDAKAVVGVIAVAGIVKAVRGGAAVTGIVGVVIGGHTDPIHILVSGIEIGNGPVPVADIVRGENHLDVAVPAGGVGHLAEGLDIGSGVTVGPVVHLGAHPEQDSGIQAAQSP